MLLRIFSVALLGAIVCSRAAAVAINDTYDQVVQEKGTPTGKMQAGNTVILRYADETIRLKSGRVVAVEANKSESHEAAPAPTPSVAPQSTDESPPPPANVALAWTTDYRGALATAKEQNRRVFLLFTGSDWCPWCKRLDREILSTPEFAQYADANLVLVEVDFPRSKTLSKGVRKQNYTLQRYFEITGYPTVVVLDPDGHRLGQLGYHEGGPSPFIKQLQSL